MNERERVNRVIVAAVEEAMTHLSTEKGIHVVTLYECGMTLLTLGIRMVYKAARPSGSDLPGDMSEEFIHTISRFVARAQMNEDGSRN